MTHNNTILHKFLAAALVVSLGCTCFGCGSEETEESSSSGENIAMEDMEYGATMREDADVYAVPLTYDKRYLEAGELEALANYYDAVQNQDDALLQEVTIDFYMQSLYDTAYGGLLDDRAYVAQQYSKYQKALDTENDITFSLISVTDCLYQDDSGSEADYLIEMFNELNEDDSYCDNHLESMKTLTVVPTVTDGTDTAECDQVPIYIVCLDGTYYVCA